MYPTEVPIMAGYHLGGCPTNKMSNWRISYCWSANCRLFYARPPLRIITTSYLITYLGMYLGRQMVEEGVIASTRYA